MVIWTYDWERQNLCPWICYICYSTSNGEQSLITVAVQKYNRQPATAKQSWRECSAWKVRITECFQETTTVFVQPNEITLYRRNGEASLILETYHSGRGAQFAFPNKEGWQSSMKESEAPLPRILKLNVHQPRSLCWSHLSQNSDSAWWCCCCWCLGTSFPGLCCCCCCLHSDQQGWSRE